MKWLKKCSKYLVWVTYLFIAKILMKSRHLNPPRTIRSSVNLYFTALEGGVEGGDRNGAKYAGTGSPDGCGHGRITKNRQLTVHVYKYMLGVCKT